MPLCPCNPRDCGDRGGCNGRMPKIHPGRGGHEAIPMRLRGTGPGRGGSCELLRRGEAAGAEPQMHVRRDAFQHRQELRRQARGGIDHSQEVQLR